MSAPQTSPRQIDLNNATREDLAAYPLIGQQYTDAIVRSRPIKNWDDVERVAGLPKDLVDQLVAAGAQLGGASSGE